MSAHSLKLIVVFLLFLCVEAAASEQTEKLSSLPDLAKSSLIAQPSEEILRYLKQADSNVYAKRTGPCTFESLQKFHGELATHQQVTLDFQYVDQVTTGKTLAPNRNDTQYRAIAEKRPYAVFFRSQSGGSVTSTQTWFEPNLFKLPKSFSSENEDAFFVQTEDEMENLKTVIAIFSAQCSKAQFTNQP